MSTALEKETPPKRIKWSKPLPPKRERERILTEISREMKINLEESRKQAPLADAKTLNKSFDF